MEFVSEINTKYLKQVKKARLEIKNDRKNFWNKNSVNFKNSIKTLTGFFKFPEGWNVNIIASNFLLDKPSMPYDLEVWSFSDVVSATKGQGYEIVIFFNKTDLGYLSAPALLPIVVHEVKHVFQVPKDTKKYVLQAVDDDLIKEFETDADVEVKKYSDEFRKQNVLEKVMFCYDAEGWKGAKKMVEYLHEEAKDAFGGGYDENMIAEEYEVFKKAEDEKDIEIFIDHFINSFKEVEEKK